ncbi:RNA polymerase sigma-70 factor [Flavobacterium sp. 316]|uniref:RNA polymerase sigma factor n=1 Tax=Flavobacterium sp. 316 TaxID=1603293 RepID=UPI0005E39498|nr:RNA polymerase sigma factor [Flavobacterium sp. 316]KIX21882.1 RNA polymerase sigma-70 factor [Flavobacterium sp. 316]
MILKEIIQKCIKGDRTSQKDLYNFYKNDLFHLSLKYCSSVSDAEDNLQDSFIEIFSSIKKYNHKGSFEGWMKRITINKAIDKYKKSIKNNNNEPYLFTEEPDFDENESIDISVDEILELVQNLPNQYRIVFNLFQLENNSHKEIAMLLNISEGTSKSNYHRAKLILREQISNKKNHKIIKQA